MRRDRVEQAVGDVPLNWLAPGAGLAGVEADDDAVGGDARSEVIGGLKNGQQVIVGSARNTP